jgi:hypothetical protein
MSKSKSKSTAGCIRRIWHPNMAQSTRCSCQHGTVPRGRSRASDVHRPPAATWMSASRSARWASGSRRKPAVPMMNMGVLLRAAAGTTARAQLNSGPKAWRCSPEASPMNLSSPGWVSTRLYMPVWGQGTEE